MAGYYYDKIIKYTIDAVCDGPLHIGGTDTKEAVLIHPVERKPFIQASGIAGAFRCFYAYSHEKSEVETLFGSSEVDANDCIKFEDGIFKEDTIRMERRAHVSIDKQTGSVSSANGSGQKFDLEYVGAGAKFSTAMYLYVNQENEKPLVTEFESILATLKSGDISFGAKKSSGGGRIHPEAIAKAEFNMKDKEDRAAWSNDDKPKKCEDILKTIDDRISENVAYKIVVSGKTEGAIQVRAIAVSTFGEGAPDSENIKNAKGDYIVPGSSVRGVIRSRMEQIESYLNKTGLIALAFGKTGETQNEGHAGNLIFSDVVIGKQNENEGVVMRHRIHIDKFTGGVMAGGLFTEKNAVGKIDIVIEILNKNNPDVVLGLLLMALRDLSIKTLSVGNGYATGKGFIDVDYMEISSSKGKARLSFGDNIYTEDDAGIINDALASLKEA